MSVHIPAQASVFLNRLVASFNVEGFGLERMQQISREDIEERMEAYRQMLSF